MSYELEDAAQLNLALKHRLQVIKRLSPKATIFWETEDLEKLVPKYPQRFSDGEVLKLLEASIHPLEMSGYPKTCTADNIIYFDQTYGPIDFRQYLKFDVFGPLHHQDLKDFIDFCKKNEAKAQKITSVKVRGVFQCEDMPDITGSDVIKFLLYDLDIEKARKYQPFLRNFSLREIFEKYLEGISFEELAKPEEMRLEEMEKLQKRISVMFKNK